MRLYKVKMIIRKKGNRGLVTTYAKDEKLILDNLDTAENIYNEYMETLKFNCNCMKKLYGYVAIYKPAITEDGTITDQPLNDEYIKKFDY